MRILSTAEWRDAARSHTERAASLTEDHRRRRQAGRSHPIFDFLFDYYPVRVAQLKTWHPGVGVRLQDAPSRRFYQRDDADTLGVDVDEYLQKRGGAVRHIYELLLSTQATTSHFDCFGLHEWAMVYKTTAPRHDLPLRLGPAGTDAVVESHQLRCTHYDAFRFFTDAAVPLNLTVLHRDTQIDSEQCGCLHATMDLYKWAAKLGPLLSGTVLLDSFELARDTRILDMEASPYDCRGLGFSVVAIETAAGKSEYVRRQRELSERAAPLRAELISVCEQALSACHSHSAHITG